MSIPSTRKALSSLQIGRAIRGLDSTRERVSAEARIRDVEAMRRSAVDELKRLRQDLGTFELRSSENIARLERVATEAEQRAFAARAAYRKAGLEDSAKTTTIRGGIAGRVAFLRTTASTELLHELEVARTGPRAILEGLDWFGVTWETATREQREAGSAVAGRYREAVEQLLEIPTYDEQVAAIEALVLSTMEQLAATGVSFLSESEWSGVPR